MKSEIEKADIPPGDHRGRIRCLLAMERAL
nr:MAG TPA: hypothetical protein [Caudoviricetes sp.]